MEHEKEQFAKATIQDVTLFLDTTITPALEAEGLARELIRRIQSMRKEVNLAVEDRIVTEIAVGCYQNERHWKIGRIISKRKHDRNQCRLSRHPQEFYAKNG